MVEKDGAWINDAKIAAGRDINQNTIPLKCEPDGVLDVNAIISGITGPIDVIVDNIVPVSQSGTWTVGVNNFPTIQDVIVENTLVPSVFDYVAMSPTGTNPTTIVYKTGGPSGTTVATLTLTYDANNNVQTVTKT